MNILQEIEEMRQRVLREVNTEFDRLLERVWQSGDCITVQPGAYEIQYPLDTDPGIFKGKKPTSVIIKGESIEVKTWKELVRAVIDKCMETKENIISLYGMAGHVAGKKRVLLASTGDGMRSPMELGKNLYMETHYDTETLLKILVTRILLPIGYDMSDVWVLVRNERG